MGALGFPTTNIFEPLFTSSNLTLASTLFAQGKNSQPSPAIIQQKVDRILASASSTQEKPVSNSGRLRPIIRNSAGKRIDKGLRANENLITRMKKHNLCSWHYLRADCMVAPPMGSCKRNHTYARPLSPVEYDAQWCIARQGRCYNLRKGGDCTDDQCMYGHSGS